MKLIHTFSVLSVALASASSIAGQESHGGGALDCSDGVILYDLFEAQIPNELPQSPSAGFTIRDSSEPVETQVLAAFERAGRWVGPALRRELTKRYHRIKAAAVDVPQGMSLVTPDDINPEMIMDACTLKGVASYNDAKNRLLIDRKLFDRMSPTNQAALWVHETIYKLMRDTHPQENSRSARLAVAYLFAENAPEKPDEADFFPTNYLSYDDPIFPNPKPSHFTASRGAVYYYYFASKCEDDPTVWQVGYGPTDYSLDESVYVRSHGVIKMEIPATLGRGYEHVKLPVASKDELSVAHIQKCNPRAQVLDAYFRPIASGVELSTKLNWNDPQSRSYINGEFSVTVAR